MRCQATDGTMWHGSATFLPLPLDIGESQYPTQPHILLPLLGACLSKDQTDALITLHEK